MADLVVEFGAPLPAGHMQGAVDQPGLVSAAAAVAGLAIENECLHTQARAHLIESKASRAGTVAAAGAERRRLEGNLHDGAQQPMLNLMLGLRLATVTVGANSDNGEQPAIEGNSERGGPTCLTAAAKARTQ